MAGIVRVSVLRLAAGDARLRCGAALLGGDASARAIRVSGRTYRTAGQTTVGVGSYETGTLSYGRIKPSRGHTRETYKFDHTNGNQPRSKIDTAIPVPSPHPLLSPVFLRPYHVRMAAGQWCKGKKKSTAIPSPSSTWSGPPSGRYRYAAHTTPARANGTQTMHPGNKKKRNMETASCAYHRWTGVNRGI